jgi:hypothetical protein
VFSKPKPYAANKLEVAYSGTRNFDRRRPESAGSLIKSEGMKGSASDSFDEQSRVEAKKKLLRRINLHHATNIHRKVCAATRDELKRRLIKRSRWQSFAAAGGNQIEFGLTQIDYPGRALTKAELLNRWPILPQNILCVIRPVTSPLQN